MRNNLLNRVAFLGLVGLAACSGGSDVFDPQKNDQIDRYMGLSRDDYRHMSEPRPGSEESKTEARDRFGSQKETEAPIPDMSEILAAPRPPKIGETQLVSIAVTDDVPLKDVLIELSRLADVDVELDSGIAGGISFTAKEKPFNQVIERIADLAGLRYSMKGGVLRVERDTPYIISYPLDFLNMNRSATSSVNISTNVLSGGGGGGGGGSSGGSSGGGGGGGGLNTGSSTSVSAESESDFWEALETGVQVVLNYVPPSRAQQQAAPQIVSAPAQAAQSATTPATAASQAVASADQPAAAPAAAPAPAPAPAPASGGASSSGSAGANGMINANTYYILNRQGGTLTVSATQRQHELLKVFLQKVQRNASAQVLIEAKLVEITLSDEFQSGVDWSAIRLDPLTGNPVTGSGALGAAGVFSNTTFDPSGVMGISGERTVQVFGLDINLSQAVALAQRFGVTRTISSPRLNAINNQQATLTFAENDVYFTIEIEREDEESASGTREDRVTVTSTPNTVPLGIILAVQPSINLDTNEVTLNVRPTLSKKLREVADPGVQLAAADAGIDVQSNIPVIEVRELDSILKIKSGEVMVIGGLMEQRSENEELGVPGLASIPWVGNLFKASNKTENNRELVIFIKATIIGNRGYYHDTDKNVYKKFIRDPRPIAF